MKKILVTEKNIFLGTIKFKNHCNLLSFSSLSLDAMPPFSLPHPDPALSHCFFLRVQNTCRILREPTTATAVSRGTSDGSGSQDTQLVRLPLPPWHVSSATSVSRNSDTPTPTHTWPGPRVPPEQPADAISPLPNSLLNQKPTPSRLQKRKLKIAHPPLPLPLSPGNSSGFSPGEGIKGSLPVGNGGQVSPGKEHSEPAPSVGPEESGAGLGGSMALGSPHSRPRIPGAAGDGAGAEGRVSWPGDLSEAWSWWLMDTRDSRCWSRAWWGQEALWRCQPWPDGTAE